MTSKNKKYKFAHIDLRKKVKDQNEIPTTERDLQEEATLSVPKPESKIDASKSAIEVDDTNLEPSANSNKVIALVAIIAGILVMIAGFTIYQYFNQAGNISNEASSTITNINKAPLELDPKTSNKPVFAGDYEGIIPGKSLEEVKPNTNKSSPTTPIPVIANPEPSISQISQVVWQANNYNHGDIQRGKYTVKSGDTLWEIAEGAYGNGANWIQIAQANNVDYFSNGRPLIHPGQILNIP